MYPFEASDRSIVAKDRRGELFYYMHQQVGQYANQLILNEKILPVDCWPLQFWEILQQLTSRGSSYQF